MKKAISIVLTTVMLLSLVLTGCDTKEENTSSNIIKIGGVGSLTGKNAFYGQEVKNGMMLALEEINMAGGICGKKAEILYVDDQSNEETVIEAYNELKEWGAHMIVGAVTSDECIVLGAETARDNIFQITPSGSAVEAVKQYNAFQVCFSDPNQGRAAAEYIYEQKLGDKIAVIYDTSSTYSTGIFRGFSDKAHEIGLEMVTIDGFDQSNDEDFTDILKDVKEAGADLVFLPIYYQQASVIIRQAELMGVKVKFFGCDGMEGILEAEGFDPDLAEGLMYLTPYLVDEMSESAIEFAQKYEEKYGSKPSQFAADAYDAVYILKVVAEEAGITAKMSVDKICDAMVGAMKIIRYNGITSAEGTYMSWDDNGMVEKEPRVAVIEDGEYKLK